MRLLPLPSSTLNVLPGRAAAGPGGAGGEGCKEVLESGIMTREEDGKEEEHVKEEKVGKERDGDQIAERKKRK